MSMSKHTILIVEDEWMVAEDIRSSLSEHGYDAYVATSGHEAIALAERCTPMLILMDVHLKGAMLGTEAAQKIRDKLGTPVVYLTAHADQATLESAQATEPLAFLIKPIKMNTLIEQVDTAVSKLVNA
jgi:CheY-like chemotaxis protein